VVLALRRFIGPGISLAGWGLLQGHFLLGVLVLYVGILVSLGEVVYDPYFRKRPLIIQIVLIAVVLCFFDVFTIYVVAGSAPLETSATSSVPKYGPGTRIADIEWEDVYSALNFYIKNPSGVDYDDFDAEISTDLVIAKLHQLDGLASCTIASSHPPLGFHVQPMRGDQPLGPADSQNEIYAVVPLDKNGNPIVPVSGGADWSYRIHCDKIPSHSQSDFFAALEVVNPIKDGRLPLRLFGTPAAATWIAVNASFETSGRVRKVPALTRWANVCCAYGAQREARPPVIGPRARGERLTGDSEAPIEFIRTCRRKSIYALG